MQINRILVANRGEIAVRIIRTCRMLGIETVLAVSEADRDSLGTQLATRTVCIGPARASESYLKVDTVVQAALSTGADAVHPGYGFLSEIPALAAACDENDLIFIGPTAEQIAAVGDKLEARRIAEAAGIPVVPGGQVNTAAEALALSRDIGVPLLIKAVAGGGGRGMRLAEDVTRLEEMVELAMAEAGSAFGDSRIYMERYVAAGRHVEVQLLGDGETILHLGDRDCSVQRRYQKLVEEAPAPQLPDRLRTEIHDAALRFGRHIGYRGLGTVEFLVDQASGQFYFLEMNARIQVEHPVTEAVTGLDLVAQQIHIASGLPLALAQETVGVGGHSIECRLNAEDVAMDFAPRSGRIDQVWFPSGPGIRIDTHIQAGTIVSPYYDSMMAKVVVWGEDRRTAIGRMREVLRAANIVGLKTNLPLHELIVGDPAFAEGGVDTGYLPALLARRGAELGAPEKGVEHGAG